MSLLRKEEEEYSCFKVGCRNPSLAIFNVIIQSISRQRIEDSVMDLSYSFFLLFSQTLLDFRIMMMMMMRQSEMQNNNEASQCIRSINK